MPKKKNETAWTKTLIVRISQQQDEDLRIAAEVLGLDVSNLVRVLLTEHLPDYMARGKDAANRAAAARVKAATSKTTKAKKGAPPGTKPADSDDELARNLEV
jgi:hypothetical protein